MLDDGFEPQLRAIFNEVPAAPRQTMLFSATWPPLVEQVALDFLTNPVRVQVGSADALRANANISQDVVFCDAKRNPKPHALMRILSDRSLARVLVFVATKNTCRALLDALRGKVPGRCESLHGGRRQEERESALEAFRSGAVRVLFATDVAGRGIDVAGVDLVVNYDPPRSPEDYVHRIGRTGRGGASGNAVSLLEFLLDGDAMKYIAEVMIRTGVPIPKELAHRLGPSLPGWRPLGGAKEPTMFALPAAAMPVHMVATDKSASSPSAEGKSTTACISIPQCSVSGESQRSRDEAMQNPGNATATEAATEIVEGGPGQCCQCGDPPLSDWVCTLCANAMCKDCHATGVTNGFPADICWHCAPSNWSLEATAGHSG